MPKRKQSMYDIRDIAAIALKRKWLLIVPLILVSAATFAGSYLIEPEYEASTIISVYQQVRLSTEVQRLLGVDPSYRLSAHRRDVLRGYYNELTSTLFLLQLVERLKLDQDPGLNRKANEIASRTPRVSLDEVKYDLIQNGLKEKIGVSYAAENQIKITTQSTDPIKARDIANTLGEIFIAERLKQELTSIRTSQDFSDVQLQKYEKQLEDKTRERTQLEQQILRIQVDERITAESNRSDIALEIDQANNEINTYQSKEREVLQGLSSVPGLSVNKLELGKSDVHKQLQSELRNLLRSLAERITKHTWSDPQILNLKLRQNNVEANIEQENRSQVNQQFAEQDEDTRRSLVRLFNYRSNLDFLYSKVSYLQASLEELTDKMNLIPEYQAQLNRLIEEIVTATDIRDRFKRQQESSSISQALLQDASSSKYRVVEPAKRPLMPFKPDRKSIVFAGIALGLMIGAGAVIIAELMDNTLKRVEDVEEYLGLPVLGITPKTDFMKKIHR